MPTFMRHKNTWFLPLLEHVERQAQIMENESDGPFAETDREGAIRMAVDNVTDDRGYYVEQAGGHLPDHLDRPDVYDALIAPFEDEL